jgi:hypothetical protein
MSAAQLFEQAKGDDPARGRACRDRRLHQGSRGTAIGMARPIGGCSRRIRGSG